jgi:predicted Zn-dependent protease
VEDGRIVGQVKDVMVAGNAYETLSNIVELSRERSMANVDMGGGMGYVPAVLCENVERYL